MPCVFALQILKMDSGHNGSIGKICQNLAELSWALLNSISVDKITKKHRQIWHVESESKIRSQKWYRNRPKWPKLIRP